MKHNKWAALLLALCMLLCACTDPGGNDTGNDPTDNIGQQTPDQGDTDRPDDGTDQTGSVFPSDLAMELVVDSNTANILLSYLDTLAAKLRDAVEAAGYQPDTVTITFSTAGAYTTDSLQEGGIAIAVLPALDIITCKHACVIALSSEEIPETAIAVSMADGIFSEDLCAVLFRAFTETEAGSEFLSLCCGDTTFVSPTEEKLQMVRDYLAELEKDGGHV